MQTKDYASTVPESVSSRITSRNIHPDHDDDNTRAYARACARARERANHEKDNGGLTEREERQRERIESTYRDAIGLRMSEAVWNDCQAIMSHGAEESLIHAVLTYTAYAPRPSWRYARVVLRNSLRDGIVSATDFHNGGREDY